MDRLTTLRAPLAVVALAALTLTALARVLLGLSQLVGSAGSTAVGAARLAPNASDAALTVLAGVLVAACALGPAVPALRRLATWGAVLAAVSVVATVAALALTDLEVAGWSLVWLVPDVAVPVVVGVGLLALARAPRSALDAGAAAPAALEAPPASETEAPPGAEPDPELQPAWTPDAAAGAVWRTAGEAASGAPAAGWGSSPAWSTGEDEAGWSFRRPGTPAATPLETSPETPSAGPSEDRPHDGPPART